MIAFALAGTMGIVAGCGRESSNATSNEVALSPADEEVLQEVNAELSEIINEETHRYEPLQYEYNEDLLVKLDRIESLLSEQATGEIEAELPEEQVDFFPALDEQQEMAHLRETVRRWEAQTGRDLRETIEPLKADVAARDPKKAFHPEFQKDFSQAFDSFIKIEVDEIRERRNRAIHERADDLLEPYREDHPEVVQQVEETLNRPPYNVPQDEDSSAPASVETKSKERGGD